MLPVTVQFIVAMLAYALNQRMARKAESLREENRVLKEALQVAAGKRRLELSDEQRRRLATQGKALTPAERFVKTIRTECLDQFVSFGERHLRYLLREFCARYHGERFYQGFAGQLIKPRALAGNDNGTAGTLHCRSPLGGLIDFFHREAA